MATKKGNSGTGKGRRTTAANKSNGGSARKTQTKKSNGGAAGKTAKRTTNQAHGTKKRRVRFGFRAEPGATVAVAGTFNGWNPEKIVLKDKTGKGDYEKTVLLEPGRYEYKFVVNGTWHPDPENPNWVHNEFGTLNSVIEL